MQIIQTDQCEELSNMLEGSTVLSTIDHAGIRLYVVNRDGKDSLIFSGTNNSGFVVYPCESDASWGGSIHDLARSAEPIQP